MKPFSRSWVKLNQKTWRNTESGFTVCNESYKSISGLNQKMYCIYAPHGKDRDGNLLAVKDSLLSAKITADKYNKQIEDGTYYD